jgi:hypothetical protein
VDVGDSLLGLPVLKVNYKLGFCRARLLILVAVNARGAKK